jgi:hypothetical protein
MKKYIHIGDALIPIVDYAISGTAILGIRDSGKTYAAKGIVEQLLDAEVPPIIVDPIGRWRYLKMAGDDSKHPKGYKVVVAGGEQPDLPLTVQSAAEIVRAAIRENIPLVLDLYDRKLSKADWRRIVQIVFRTLMYENKGVRHIVMEEAAEFVPQKVMDGETYAEVEKVVRMGGNVSLGVTLINQRAQEVNKAVLDLCANVVLLKQRGSHAIDSLEKLIDKLSPQQAAEVIRSLPRLGPGEGWLFTSDREEPRKIQTGPIRSFHPDRRRPQLSAKAVQARTTDTDDFVSRLSGVLDQVIAEAKASDPALLRRRVAELEKALSARAAATSTVDTKAIADKAFQEGCATATKRCHAATKQLVQGLHVAMDKAVGTAFDKCLETIDTPLQWRDVFPNAFPTMAPVSPKSRVVSHTDGKTTETRGFVSVPGAPLPKGEAAILRACIMQPGAVTREALTVMTGYLKSTRDEYINRLRNRGFIHLSSDGITATDAGREAMPDAEPLPTGDRLRDFWLQKLPAGECKLLELLIRIYPQSMPRDGLDEAGYKKSSRNEYLNRLRNRKLITEGSDGMRASDNLFEAA